MLTVVIDTAHDVDQIRPRLWGLHTWHDLLPLGRGEELRRHGRRHVRGRGRRAGRAARLLHGVGRLQPVDDGHHLGLRRERRRLLRVVLGGGRGLHGARLRVEEEVGRVEVVVAGHLGHRLRHEQLARAHDLRLERELLERRDEGGRLEDRGDGRANVARHVRGRLEEDLAREVLAIH